MVWMAFKFDGTARGLPTNIQQFGEKNSVGQ
jgi:hypothetical protein